MKYLGPSIRICYYQCDDPSEESSFDRLKLFPMKKGASCPAGQFLEKRGECDGDGICIPKDDEQSGPNDIEPSEPSEVELPSGNQS